MEEKLNKEVDRLSENQNRIIHSLNTQLNLQLISQHTYNELLKDINHLYSNEIDYLVRNPNDYFEIYEQ